jgi:hypothetical protein
MQNTLDVGLRATTWEAVRAKPTEAEKTVGLVRAQTYSTPGSTQGEKKPMTMRFHRPQMTLMEAKERTLPHSTALQGAAQNAKQQTVERWRLETEHHNLALQTAFVDRRT